MPALLLALALAAAPATGSPARAPDAKTELQGSMQSSMAVVVGLQPYLVSPAAFRDPANAGRITGAIDTLSSLEHHLLDAICREPPKCELATIYARQAAQAKRDFTRGDTEAARIRLRNIGGLCIGCHVRTPTGKQFDDAAALVDGLRVGPLERAEYYAMTRQFDRALETWQAALVTSPKDDVEAWEQAQAVRLAIAVAVRLKDDPAVTIALLEQQRRRSVLPGFVQHHFETWLASARKWQAEKISREKLSPRELVMKAQALVDASRATQTPEPASDHYVSLLRAASYLTEALNRHPSGEWRPQALYLLGVISASTNDPLLWQLEWLYFEVCIRENPHSAIARKCSDRLFERTYFTYSQRSIESMPPETAGELRVLRELAAPRKK